MIAARVRLVGIALALGAASGAWAQQTPPPDGPADIVGISGTGGNDGRVGVNAAAGNQSQQANVAVIAIGENAVAVGAIKQVTDAPASPPSPYQSALISDGAFANSNGMIAVNVAAGSGHQQANLAVFAIGIEGQVVSDAMLSQTRASSSPSGGSEQTVAPEVVAGVSPGAFAGSSGLVQVSLVGGERNSSANIFVLTSKEGANP